MTFSLSKIPRATRTLPRFNLWLISDMNKRSSTSLTNSKLFSTPPTNQMEVCLTVTALCAHYTSGMTKTTFRPSVLSRPWGCLRFADFLGRLWHCESSGTHNIFVAERNASSVCLPRLFHGATARSTSRLHIRCAGNRSGSGGGEERDGE